MSQRVNNTSKRKRSENKFSKVKKLILLDPKPDELFMDRLKEEPEDRTLVCCKIQGRSVNRSEKLIEFGDSWFSVKTI